MLHVVWEFLRPGLQLPSFEDWPMIKQAFRRLWAFAMVAAIALFFAGMAWANRTSADLNACWQSNADNSQCWRLSNNQLRQTAIRWSSGLRAYQRSREREIRTQGPSIMAQESMNLASDYASTYRTNAIDLADTLEWRLRSQDRNDRNRAQLSKIYDDPQRIEDLTRIADDIEWMAKRIPRHSPWHWFQATFWLWN
jgi:hypothetical protein